MRPQRFLTIYASVAAWWLSVASVALPAEDATIHAIREVMVENLAAADAEDMPRLLATMSLGMPNRELFIQSTTKEWAVAGTCTRRIESDVLKRCAGPPANSGLPYASVRAVQSMLSSKPKECSPVPFGTVLANGSR